MGAHDTGEVRARRLQVVVVTVDPHPGQLVGLLPAEDAQARRDLDVDRLPDRLHALAHLRHQALVRAPYRGDDAELCGARSTGPPGRLDQLGDVQPRRPDRGGKLTALAAEM